MLNRIEKNQDRSVEDYGDDVWSFFQNCWHLKDWIKNDPRVPGCIRNSIEEFLKTQPSIIKCADLANATKHLELKHPRVGDEPSAKPSHSNMTIIPGESSTVVYLIDSATGPKQNALDLARDCLLEWERLLAEKGLAEH